MMLSNNDQIKTLPGFERINKYWDKVNEINVAKILPGEFYVTTGEEAISTVLGSCISACVRDKHFSIGGMNHFMLPMSREYGIDSRAASLSDANRYGNFAMENLINTVLKYGGRKENLEVKIFGGGRILAQMTDVGFNNITFIKEYLISEGLTILAEDTGDTYPRKVMYFPSTGKVMLKKLRSLHNNTIVSREMEYRKEIEAVPVAGDIELFD